MMLVALRSFAYDGRRLIRGEVFTAPEKHARLLTLAKSAIPAPAAVTLDPPSEPTRDA